MKRFFKKIAMASLICVVLPVLFTLAFFALASDAMNMEYTAAIGDKVERLASIEESKIILIGNSNLAFGIDSETIEAAYEMPVVNMGLQAGLGNAFMEQITKSYIGEGDVVVLAYSTFANLKLSDATILYPMMISCVDVASLVKEDYLFETVKALPTCMWERTIKLLVRGVLYSDTYARDYFNEYGDIAYERLDTTYTFTENSGISLEVSADEITRINAYNDYCESVGATLVIAGYPIGEGEYSPSIEVLDAFQQELEESLDCQLISDYVDYLIPYEYFYNTVLHLNDEGAAIRTAQLIEDLQAVIPQG